MSLPNHLPELEYELLFEKKINIQTVIRIYYHKEYKFILVQNVGFIHGEEIKLCFNKFLEFIVEKQSASVLTDYTYRKGYNKEDQEWLDNTWMPLVISKNIVKSVAYVVSPDIFAKISAQKVISKIGDDVTVKSFPNLEEALDWVKVR